MNTQNNNTPQASIDEPFDQLVEIGLMELVGGAAPPDLSAKIAAASMDAQLVPSTLEQSPRERHPLRWFAAAITAMLMVGGATLLYQMTRFDAKSAVVAAKNNRVGQNQPAAKQLAQVNKLRAIRTVPAPPVAPTDQLVNDPTGQLINELNAALATTAPSGSVDLTDRYAQPEELATPAVGQPGVVAQNPNWKSSGPAPRTDTFGVAQTKSNPDRLWFRPDAKPADATTYVPLYAYTDPRIRKPALASSPATTQLSIAPLQELAPANDGTLDLYAHTAQSDDVAPQSKMPSLQRWPGLQERASRYSKIGDQYAPIVENPFIKAEGGDAVSTFGIDVDTASYSNVRQFLLDMHQLPPVNAVRIEELVNYFHYDYASPTPTAPGSAGDSSNGAPFAAHVEVAGCPWNAEHRLARIAIKGREMERDKRPPSNLVFLVDVSGSMNDPVRLPLVKYGLEQLTKELGENDHIAIVTYAGTTGVALPSTSGSKQDVILAALRKLEAGGSTGGGAGIQLAYQIAEENFIKGGTNRVILCTDGDFNVGTTSTDELQKLVATKAKDTGVFISTLGFGRGNLNDAMMVAISDHGNGNYHYIDNRTEARRVLVEQMTGTLVTIANDVKIQVEFNPAKVAAYRLIGYEKRMLKTEDFNNDKKDAGEIGAGHTVTALYEIVPAGEAVETPPPLDELKYQKAAKDSAATREVFNDVQRTLSADASSEMLTLKMRYKAPDGDTSQKLEWPVADDGKSIDKATEDFRFAASVAGFGMLLRDSQFKGELTFKDVMKTAENAIGHDDGGYRSEFLEMAKEAQRLKGE